jgi:ComF family protein
MSNDEFRICNNCWNELTPLSETEPTFIEKKKIFAQHNAVDGFQSCFLFEKNKRIQDIIHGLKYEQRTKFGFELGKRLGEKLKRENNFLSANFLIPIPLHKRKLRERGYNQSDFVAKGISSVTKIPVATKLLSREKYTQSQTHLTFQERQENVKEVFAVKEKFQKEVHNKSIILVDDVITTGATIFSAANSLRNSGVKNVFAVSAALTEYTETN